MEFSVGMSALFKKQKLLSKKISLGCGLTSHNGQNKGCQLMERMWLSLAIGQLKWTLILQKWSSGTSMVMSLFPTKMSRFTWRWKGFGLERVLWPQGPLNNHTLENLHSKCLEKKMICGIGSIRHWWAIKLWLFQEIFHYMGLRQKQLGHICKAWYMQATKQ